MELLSILVIGIVILALISAARSLSKRKQPLKYINSNGYVVLSDNNELEHRQIVIDLLGRSLAKDECVHHVNGKRTDNRVSNLCLMNKEKHEHFHAWLRWKREKSGRYPSIAKQKVVLEKEYGGRLAEQITTSLDEIKSQKLDKSHEVNDLFMELKKLRKDLAKASNLPVYMVVSNDTLFEIARRQPANKEEMLKISGIGEVKLERYGDVFLDHIVKFKLSG
jgi:superfamily II DNA helicase RecQ